MSLCGMPYEDLGYDCSSELWDEKLVTARKRHRCEECGSEIEPGERCGHAKGLIEGEWWWAYRCQSCLVLAEMVGTATGECAAWGRLDEYIAELTPEGEEFPSPREHRQQWEAVDDV